ncbi:MAG TPA: lytic murein transglycosylase [Pseudolabrys sp.]|nr:lytic murein transglycosylase [Pseudolabrys sp.]
MLFETRRFATLLTMRPIEVAKYVTAAVVVAIAIACPPSHAADPAFQKWLAAQWPAAQALGVSRATFDAATRGLEPDLSLPDLDIPGKPEKQPPQPEFVQTPAQYLREAAFQRLAAQGQQLAAQHRDTLARIEKEFGVPGNVVLAIWARETDYGGYQLPLDAIRTLATQAYVGKRKDFFQNEFLHALKMLQDGVPRADMRSSWGGAMGLTQFLPSEFYKYAVDFDGDGRVDIWRSVSDALASAAKQLAGKGWQSGQPWAIEIHAPAGADCSIGVPEVTKPVGEWVKLGFTPAYGRKLSTAELSYDASLLQPEGSYGPSFLAPKNYFVLKDYNYSDLYVLFVGHLSERIAGGRPFETPWSKSAQLKTADVETMQRRLTTLGLYRDKIDGKAGMLTRAALGAYQKKNGLKVDCWPTAAVLDHMRR